MKFRSMPSTTVHRENRFSSWGNETGLLRFFGNKTTQFFSGQSNWPAHNSRKVRLAGMPATAGSLPPMNVQKDQLNMNEKQLFISTPNREATEREESRLTTHRSNQNTGTSISQADHDDTLGSVSLHISYNVRSHPLLIHLSQEIEQVSQHIAQGLGNNIAKKLDHQQATH